MNYYNEIDPQAAAWLRELIKVGHIPEGFVDERDIRDVLPSDLDGYTQCHFFAGIGGWPLALALAKWGDRPVWTGSCPCQPFSAAGKRGGTADERHLWPAFHWLIEQCRPPVVFGEQVASPAGRAWLDLVATDCEGAGYAFAAADLPAAGVEAPHLRNRLWWVANQLADANHERPQGRLGTELRERTDQCTTRPSGAFGELADSNGRERNGIPDGEGCERDRQATGREQGYGEPERSSKAGGFWDACDWIPCRDGKYRPVEPGTFPLAHGVPARVGRLRGYGNAIVPQVAQAFIEAYLTR